MWCPSGRKLAKTSERKKEKERIGESANNSDVLHFPQNPERHKKRREKVLLTIWGVASEGPIKYK